MLLLVLLLQILILLHELLHLKNLLLIRLLIAAIGGVRVTAVWTVAPRWPGGCHSPHGTHNIWRRATRIGLRLIVRIGFVGEWIGCWRRRPLRIIPSSGRGWRKGD